MTEHRYTIHPPQLVDREWQDAANETQRFLRYLMDANDGTQIEITNVNNVMSEIQQTLNTVILTLQAAIASSQRALAVASEEDVVTLGQVRPHVHRSDGVLIDPTDTVLLVQVLGG